MDSALTKAAIFGGIFFDDGFYCDSIIDSGRRNQKGYWFDSHLLSGISRGQTIHAYDKQYNLVPAKTIVTLPGRKGNHSSDVVLATCHRLCVVCICGLKGLSNSGRWVRYLQSFTSLSRTWSHLAVLQQKRQRHLYITTGHILHLKWHCASQTEPAYSLCHS